MGNGVWMDGQPLRGKNEGDEMKNSGREDWEKGQHFECKSVK